MKTAFLFPGQGSQVVGMGKDFYENYEEARKIFDKASEILNIDMKKLCFESDQEDLNKTENTQIAIAVTSLAILEVIKAKGIKAEISVGLSLGEYVALIYAGFISLEDGLKLLKQRGYLMGNKIPDEKYAMAAIIGTDSKLIEDVCEKVRKNGKFVVPANYNFSMQTVISGNEDGVQEASELLKESGVKKIVKLNTSGPFHTEKLNEAKELFIKELEKANFNMKANNSKVIKNLNGEYYSENDDMVEILSRHIVSSVRFDKAINLMKDEKIDTFIEIGPGKALTGFVKKELKDLDIKCYAVSNVQTLEELFENI